MVPKRLWMRTAPSILLVDDGELGRVRVTLGRLGVECSVLRASAVAGASPPRDVLITSGRVAQRLPPAWREASRRATWVCVHSQDFLPLRERLKRLGVHYLLHSRVDEEAMRLFFLQLLHKGAERRHRPRLPVGCEVEYRLGPQRYTGRLLELSPRDCRLGVSGELAVGEELSVLLPPALAGGQPVVLRGRVARAAADDPRPATARGAVIAFDALGNDARAELDTILGGARIGTPVTPLEPVPARGEEPTAPPAAKPTNRRQAERHAFRGKLLNTQDCGVLLGYDLSLAGIRVDRHPAVQLGKCLTLALYGAEREEPLIVDADVVRDDGENGFGLAFRKLDREAEARLTRLLEKLPSIESIGSAGADREVIVSRLLA